MYEDHGKELTAINREALDQVTWAGTQFWLVEFLPISTTLRYRVEIHFVTALSVRHIPSWVPGAGFKKFGEKNAILQRKIHHFPWGEAQRRYVRVYLISGTKI